MHLIARLLVMLTPTLLGLQSATQYLAASYGYHPALGAPALIVHQWRLYAPWRGAQWLWTFGQQDPDTFKLPLLIAGGGVMLGILGVGVLRLLQPATQQPSTSHGSAHWATAQDVKQSGLQR